VRDPGFLATLPWAFDVRPTSSVVDRGSAAGLKVFEMYRMRYGHDIRRDFLGRPRQSGKLPDAGAFELPSGAAPPR
jgi:hypothetical protein